MGSHGRRLLRGRQEPILALPSQAPTVLCSREPSVLPSCLTRQQLSPWSQKQEGESTKFPHEPTAQS